MASAEMVAALSGVGVSVATAAGSWLAARAGRRTAQQERRDDFTAVTSRMDKEIKRLEKRVEQQEAESEQQKRQIFGQSAAITYLHNWVRDLMVFVRVNGHEPPPRRPVPDEAKPHLHQIDV